MGNILYWLQTTSVTYIGYKVHWYILYSLEAKGFTDYIKNTLQHSAISWVKASPEAIFFFFN